MLSFQALIVIFVLAFILVSFYTEIIGPAFTFLIAISVLGVMGVLTPKEILHGFANEQVLVILMLLLLGDVIRRADLIQILFDRLFRKARTYKGFMWRMMLIIASFSAFLNNTPLVAVMMPYINSWCKRNKISPSKLLIPLSYAAILGGCATLIGTSTNLIVNGMVIDQKIIPGLQELDMFSFSWVGIPMMFVGMTYILVTSNFLLKNKVNVADDFSQNSRKYVIEAFVRENSKLAGKSIAEAKLRNLNGLFLFRIEREGKEVISASSEVIIKEGDKLFFAGDTDKIADLISENGLVVPSAGMMTQKKRTDIVEIVISHNSSLVTKTIKEAKFRSKYDAAVIAVHRNGERQTGKIGNIKLKAGDVLLVMAGEDFVDRVNGSIDFYFISNVKKIIKHEPYKVWTLILGTIAAITLSIFKIVPLFTSLIVVLIIINILKLTNPKDIVKSLDLNLALIIVLALALGTAMIKTGVAGFVSQAIISLLLPCGKVVLLFGLYVITSILAAYITNKAAVAIIFPISISIAANLGINPEPFVLVVAFAAAANFMTPIGYQTNLMVYGPGGYNFRDFFRIGFPLTLIYMVFTVLILSWLYFL